jgi:hypothetical protein
MLLMSTLAALSAWLAFIWIVDPDGFRARSRLAAEKRRSKSDAASKSPRRC